jgi:sugar (pentulose or hexulose) kinase
VLLGIDIGTTHTKVGVYDRLGKTLAHVQALTPRETSPEGFEHFPPEKLWRVAAGLIRKAVHESGSEVEALAVSSMGESGVPLDAAGQPTYAIIPWNDDRSLEELHRLEQLLPTERWFATTGLVPSHIYTLTKWLWLRDHVPDAWERTRLWLSSMGYLRFKLTGEALMTDTQAARTMAFDVRRGVWSAELLELTGLEGDFLPPTVAGTAAAGEVLPEVAEQTGLRAGTPVFAGGHDHFCAALACGTLTPEAVLDSHGTAEALTLGLASPPDPSRAGGFATGPHVIPGYSYLEGGIRSSGGSLFWAKEVLGFESFEAMHKAAAGIDPNTSPLFIANLTGTSPPFNEPEANAAFVNVKRNHTAAHFARAVYEGIAFELHRCFDVLETLVSEPIRLVRMAGGSARDPMWSEIRAAILGRPLEVALNPDMVTLGAALLAGIGAGIYQSPQEAFSLTYRSQATIQPDPQLQEIYQAPYGRYRKTVEALRVSREES